MRDRIKEGNKKGCRKGSREIRNGRKEGRMEGFREGSREMRNGRKEGNKEGYLLFIYLFVISIGFKFLSLIEIPPVSLA